MSIERMERKAADNEYLHQDFHGCLSVGLEYLRENFGEDAVRNYLKVFTQRYYAPMIEEIKQKGLIVLKEYFEEMYQAEGGKVKIDFTPDELVLHIEACPAVIHMRENSYPVSSMWSETSKTVNETLCEGTPFAAELVEYDEETGKSVQRFYRRKE